MANDFNRLARRMFNLAVRFEKRVEKGFRSAALLADSVAVLGTPFDTGRARGGWQISFGAPNFSETGILDPSGQSTISKHRSQILSFTVGQGMFLSNAVPYIGRLERGHSPQNEKFTRDAAAAARNFLRKFRFLEQ